MATKIEWCDETWNPITGCTPISEGCKNCYAAKMAKRLAGRFGYPKDNPFKPGVWHDDKYTQPNHWYKPRKIFVCSMGDLFHKDVTDEQINNVIAKMVGSLGGAAHHTYMLLTKRPERIPAEKYEYFKTWPNLWLGVTAENQNRLDERVRTLLKIPAAIRFLSIEPMLSPISLRWLSAWPKEEYPAMKPNGRVTNHLDGLRQLDWIICGPETGPGKRLFDFDWARKLRDQCKEAGVPFFYKKHDHPDTPEDLRIKEFPK